MNELQPYARPEQPYFISFENDGVNEYVSEPFETVFQRLYSTPEPGLNDAMIHWSSLVLGATASTVIAKSGLYKSPRIADQKIAFGLFGGSGGARFIRNNDGTMEIARTLKTALFKAEKDPSFQSMDPLYQHAFARGSMNPFDVDIKVFWGGTPQEFFHKLNTQIDKHVSIASYGSSHMPDSYQWNIGYSDKRRYHAQSQNITIPIGLPVISLKLESNESRPYPSVPHNPFTIQITTITPQKIADQCYRSGTHIGSKQTESPGLPAPMFVADLHDEFKYSYSIAMQKQLFESAQKTLDTKTTIKNPSFTSLTQALTVGMRAVYAEHLNSTNVRETRSNYNFDQETLDKYSSELWRLYEEFINSNTPVDDYRVQEVIRAAVVCAESNCIKMINEFRDLGIFDVFLKDFIEGKISEFEEGEPHFWEVLNCIYTYFLHTSYSAPVAFAKTLQSLGYEFTQENDWGKFAEIFDVRRLRKQHNEHIE